ncbi:hypothetical protein H4683_000719 [Filibacter limicola]|uniref:Uncharacterized protein n=1 Tax=Sporosarcina limicola TaxID=34101 RepID=A0A927MFR7_9BACL|nr:hypothetical protein [Sporosarcina limicola]
MRFYILMKVLRLLIRKSRMDILLSIRLFLNNLLVLYYGFAHTEKTFKVFLFWGIENC